MDSTRSYPVQKTDEQWRQELTAEEYAVLRKAGTERPFTGEYNDTKAEGVYSCRACGAELFRSSISSMGMLRVEVRCANCGGHLGHVFEDAPQTPTGDRYCMNSVSLRLEPAKET